MRARVVALLVLPLALAGLAGCGSSSGSTFTDLSGVTIKAGASGKAPTVKVKSASFSKLTTKVVKQGSGPVVSDDTVTLMQIGLWSGVDGTQLLESWSSGQPYGLAPGDTPLIEGLADVLKGQKRGTRLAFAIPAKDAISADMATAEGTTQDDVFNSLGIKGTDDFIGVVDIVGVGEGKPLTAPSGTAKDVPAGQPTPVTDGDKVTGLDWTGVGDAPAKLQVIPLIEGTGPAIESGSYTTIDYYGEVFKAGSAFDSSYANGSPLQTLIGKSKVIAGWDQGLVGVKKGSRVLLVIPPDQAYGATPPSGSNIPANATLTFVVDVLDVVNVASS